MIFLLKKNSNDQHVIRNNLRTLFTDIIIIHIFAKKKNARDLNFHKI